MATSVDSTRTSAFADAPIGLVSFVGLIGLIGFGLPVTACSEVAESEPGRSVEVAIAPLELAGVTNACFTLSVHNGPPTAGGQLVWSRADICADDFGNGTGSITYVGPCDAGVPQDNVVSVVLQNLYDDNSTTPMGMDEYVNPCPADRPCRRSATCLENADVLVNFDITVLRDARQGFFDVAVNFADVFCSAKFDCTDGDGPLELLHDPSTQTRGPTGVLGFACTSGTGETTWMHLDDIVITCQTATTTVDPNPAQCDDEATFSDSSFGSPPWVDGYVAGGLEPLANSGTIEVAQVIGGGNTGADPDPYLEATITNRGNSTVHTWALMPTATWNPSVDGPITHLSVQYDIRLRSIMGRLLPNGAPIPVSPSQGGNAQFAIVQNGIVYAPSLGFVCPSQTDCDTWRTRSGTWDVATQIGTLSNSIPAGAATLNLTNGGPVTFGVLIGLTGGNPNYDFDYIYEVDNFSLSLEADCAEPQPGNAGPALPGTFQTAVYWGRESFANLDKCYWNVALGLKLGAGGLGNNCILETRGSASPIAFPGGATPTNATWPFIHWQVPITGPTGALICGSHAVNVPLSGVKTEYTEGTSESFDQSRECTAGVVAPTCDTPCQNGGVCSGLNICTCAEGWTGPTCGQNALTVMGYTGNAQSFVVPAGCGTVSVAAWGAGGGLGAPSGGGGFATGVLSVTPGETLEVLVGGGGIHLANPGMVNEYLAGSLTVFNALPALESAGTVNGGTGGGASEVRRGATQLLVAGAGGGGQGSPEPAYGGTGNGAGTLAGGAAGVNTDPLKGLGGNSFVPVGGSAIGAVGNAAANTTDPLYVAHRQFNGNHWTGEGQANFTASPFQGGHGLVVLTCQP